MTTLQAIHLLHHYSHMWQAIFAGHPKRTHHMALVMHEYPSIMRHCLSHLRYRRWLVGYTRAHHHLPGGDLILGA